ncbi:MAG: PEP-CTERM sorting domain-containing protein [Phenylobacterium sp.]|uniref:PEPxxWA-CTERM sorting domain-containing protein n=1 Tax=Phenylobacterium sp. TaxID=1871053 RepID=UPI001A5BBA86|nr:PEPxxWA-CTERM sorting domain-containing protein [Phenylobacterium sp.]MBL8553631.1 PEP-CTERM sorting domain-containing protein [Phenylobacterium sp.]
MPASALLGGVPASLSMGVRMRIVALAIAFFGLFWSSSAMAQISNIQSQAGSSYTTPGIVCPAQPCSQTVNLPGGAGSFPAAGGEDAPTGGAIYNSFVDIGADAITFESSHAVSQGPFTSFASSTTVSFDFYTDNSGVDFHSQITPQGLGLYLADTSNGCLFTGNCVQVSDELHTFGELDLPGGGSTGFLGGAGFSFEILDNGTPLFTLSGLLLLQANPDCPNGYCYVESLTGMENAQGVLTGFAQQTDPFDLSARAYGWDSTDVNLFLGSGHHSIEYKTSVFTFTNSECIGGSLCLVAYSGFGDPIGRGGAIDALNTFDIGAQTHQDDDLIQGLNFSPQTFRLRFNNGVLDYSPSAAVPEPGVWALMIVGFGAVGAAIRRRRTALA